ncbi:MAG: hypothetical protein ABIG95_02995 [Candidatus Woesearchaeota archaeon]
MAKANDKRLMGIALVSMLVISTGVLWALNSFTKGEIAGVLADLLLQ